MARHGCASGKVLEGPGSREQAWSHPGGGTGNTHYPNLQVSRHQSDRKLKLKYECILS